MSYCKDADSDSCVSACQNTKVVADLVFYLLLVKIDSLLLEFNVPVDSKSIHHTVTQRDLSMSAVYFLLNQISLSLHLVAWLSHASRVLLSKSATRIRELAFTSG